MGQHWKAVISTILFKGSQSLVKHVAQNPCTMLLFRAKNSNWDNSTEHTAVITCNFVELKRLAVVFLANWGSAWQPICFNEDITL